MHMREDKHGKRARKESIALRFGELSELSAKECGKHKKRRRKTEWIFKVDKWS